MTRSGVSACPRERVIWHPCARKPRKCQDTDNTLTTVVKLHARPLSSSQFLSLRRVGVPLALSQQAGRSTSDAVYGSPPPAGRGSLALDLGGRDELGLGRLVGAADPARRRRALRVCDDDPRRSATAGQASGRRSRQGVWPVARTGRASAAGHRGPLV